MVRVVVRRSRGWMRHSRVVTIDGVERGSLRGGEALELSVDAGYHSLHVGRTIVTFRALSGTDLAFRVSPVGRITPEAVDRTPVPLRWRDAFVDALYGNVIVAVATAVDHEWPGTGPPAWAVGVYVTVGMFTKWWRRPVRHRRRAVLAGTAAFVVGFTGTVSAVGPMVSYDLGLITAYVVASGLTAAVFAGVTRYTPR